MVHKFIGALGIILIVFRTNFSSFTVQVLPGVFLLLLTTSERPWEMENICSSWFVTTNTSKDILPFINQWYSQMYPGSDQKILQGNLLEGLFISSSLGKNMDRVLQSYIVFCQLFCFLVSLHCRPWKGRPKTSCKFHSESSTGSHSVVKWELASARDLWTMHLLFASRVGRWTVQIVSLLLG